MSAHLPSRKLGRSDLHVTTLGFGGAPLGNLYKAVSETEGRETLDAAIQLGIRYFDTAPYYGFGLSERRLGDALRSRTDIVISTKAGRLLTPAPDIDPSGERFGFISPMPFEPVFDYSYDGILRSHEESIERLGVSRIDVLLIHDIGRRTHGDAHRQRLAQLIDGGGIRALSQLREDKSVSTVGLGVNEVAICLELMERAQFDVLLLAGRYTLLEQTAIKDLLPRCEEEGVSVVIGGPFNSGILATGASGSANPRYNYDSAPAAVRARVSRLEEVCSAHGVSIAAAALQFPLAHPAVASVIPGFASPGEVRAGVSHFHTAIPDALWRDLRQQQLVDVRAPVPRQVEAVAQ